MLADCAIVPNELVHRSIHWGAVSGGGGGWGLPERITGGRSQLRGLLDANAGHQIRRFNQFQNAVDRHLLEIVAAAIVAAVPRLFRYPAQLHGTGASGRDSANCLGSAETFFDPNFLAVSTPISSPAPFPTLVPIAQSPRPADAKPVRALSPVLRMTVQS